MNPKEELYGRSFAIAEYDKIINDEKGKINYSRVEDHNKNFKTINEKEVRIDNVLTYFSKKNENYDIQLFLIDADALIIEDSKFLANYMDFLAELSNTNSKHSEIIKMWCYEFLYTKLIHFYESISINSHILTSIIPVNSRIIFLQYNTTYFSTSFFYLLYV